MKKILLILTILLTTSTYVNSKENSKDLPGFKNINESAEYAKCITKGKFKLNTDSKLTNIIKGKEKLKIPNPIKGIKKIVEAVTPTALEK